MRGGEADRMGAPDVFKRRLTTVLFADVVGYTRMSEEDETGTHRALRESLSLINTLVSKHHGSIAHYAGDAVLAAC